MPHKNAGQRELVARTMKAGEVIKHYYESPVHSNLGLQKQLKEKYGKGMMAMTVDRFSK